MPTKPGALRKSSAWPRPPNRPRRLAEQAKALGIGVNAGHGINYENVRALFAVPHLNELNIGHSIVSRAITVGLGQATREMIEQMAGYDAG